MQSQDHEAAALELCDCITVYVLWRMLSCDQHVVSIVRVEVRGAIQAPYTPMFSRQARVTSPRTLSRHGHNASASLGMTHVLCVRHSAADARRKRPA